MEQNSLRSEIADLEWRRVTSIAWPVLAIICTIQALSSQYPFAAWQFIFICGLALSAAISWLIRIFIRSKFFITPVIVYLLSIGVFLGDAPQKPWLSFGFIVFAAIIHFSIIENFLLATSVTIFLCIYQAYVASLRLVSFTDNEDMNLLHSYFSTLWVFIIGMAAIIIGRRYRKVAQSLQEIVDFEIQSSVTKFSRMKQINLRDSRNQKLHGTILNTLIYLRSLFERQMDLTDIQFTISEELADISKKSAENQHILFESRVQELLNNRVLHRINYKIEINLDEDPDPQIADSYIEILRELVLNSEKHTLATSGTISLYKRDSSTYMISYSDNALKYVSGAQKRLELNAPLKSKTLTKLLDECGAEFLSKFSFDRNARRISIEIPAIDLEEKLNQTFMRARNAGLNDFVMNFMLASALVAVLSLPGYLIVGMSAHAFISTTVSTLLFILTLIYPKSRLAFYPLLISSLVVIPVLSLNNPTCLELSTSPWVFNLLLSVVFFSVIRIQNRYLKWMPTLVLSLETLLYPLTYPTNCQNIYIGDLPGIPIIAVLALAVLGIRRREVIVDREESFSAAKNSSRFTDVDGFREANFKTLLGDLSQLDLQSLKKEDAVLAIRTLNLSIQKIQNFLICSEYYESEIAQELYKLYYLRSKKGLAGKIQILAESLEHLDQLVDIETLISDIGRISELTDVDVTLLKADKLEIRFVGVPETQRISPSKHSDYVTYIFD